MTAGTPEDAKNMLITALLAMDVYHRDVAGGLWKDVANRGAPTSIDDARYTGDDRQVDSIGFYARTYEMDGKLYVVYRGTDDGSLDVKKNGRLQLQTLFTGKTRRKGDQLKDLNYGYPIGFGKLGPLHKNGGSGFNSQAYEAIRYYQDVASGDIAKKFDADGNFVGYKEIVVVGQSLGGGLAGLVGSLYGLETYVYNTAPFESAVLSVLEIALAGLGGPDGKTMSEFLYGKQASEMTPEELEEKLAATTNIHAAYVPGEAIAAMSILSPKIIGILDDYGLAPAKLTALLQNAYPLRPYEYEISFSDYDKNGTLGLGGRHTSSTLVTLLFGETLEDTTWHEAMKYIWPGWINDTLA